jgi:tetratricopeptide (TPR) repeat protein
MTSTRLQAVRRQLGYSAEEVIKMVLQRADALRIPVMTPASLKTKLSRWENGHETVSQPAMRRLFREVYGRTNEELGFPPEPDDTDVDELRSRLAVARSVDAETVAAFQHQLDQMRQVDRRFGGITLLDQLRSQIKQVEGLLTYSTAGTLRQSLAVVLADASTLAGWQALDRGALSQAWDHHETAKAAAREAGSLPQLVHATGQQAFVLIDAGEITSAVQQLAYARELAGPDVAPLLRSWLAAAHGEALAAAGNHDDAFRAFDTANSLLPEDPVDPALPFLVLGGVHLDRWRGSALSKLGEAEAIDQLTEALPRLPDAFVRARTGMLVDLAFAYAAVRERDATLDYARQARRLAQQIKSDRQLRRLDGLILPTSTRIAA